MNKYIIVAWLACGVIGAGFNNAYFQRKWPDQCNGRQDLAHSFIGIVFGPANLFNYLVSGFGEYGWSLSNHANPECENK